MKHYLLLPLMLVSSTVFSMEDDDQVTTLVIAAWGTTQNKQLSSEWAEFTVKKNQHGNCSVKYRNLPKGIIMPLPVGPSDMATTLWSPNSKHRITLVQHDDGIKLVLHKSSWYTHPAFTHSALVLTVMLLTYAAC